MISKIHFQKATYCGINLQGISVAGIGTCFVIPELKLCFDVAQGLPYATNMRNFLITHGHMDHAGGIPYIISQKALTKQNPPTFYMPESMLEPMTKIIKTWEQLEDHQYKYHFFPVEEDKYYEINNNYCFKVFPTVHRIPSYGYTLFKKTKKLKKEYSGNSKKELIKAKDEGKDIEEILYEPMLSFTGDTKIEFLDKTPWVKNSKVLMMEVTYIDEKKSVEEAREWGHIHLEELLPRLKDLNCEKVVLKHLSSRHRVSELNAILDERLTTEERQRVEVYPH